MHYDRNIEKERSPIFILDTKYIIPNKTKRERNTCNVLSILGLKLQL